MEIDDATATPSTTNTTEDVDSDCNNLLQEFSRLGTTDRDVLISKMQQLTHGLSTMESTFFLEMNNWNLEAALWTYYELSSQVAGNNPVQQQQNFLQQIQNTQLQQQLPQQQQQQHIGDSWAVNLPARSMTLIADRTIGNGEAVTPDTAFIKSWRLKNTGHQPWPVGSVLKFVDGQNLHGHGVLFPRIVAPNEEIDISVQLRSPSVPGCYQSRWQLHDDLGPFGDTILISVEVQDGGVMAVTQQMDACHARE